MTANINDPLNETSAEDLPTETAAKFTAARSRDSVKNLLILSGAFSLDRSQDIFRFASYLNFAASDGGVQTWCQFIWDDLGIVLLAAAHPA
ncbi:hypothetical protein E4U61_001992 [Claviceps capensis]|nr:hypothetical protein E4U61_001992 [Claviceps capensis]